VANRNITEAEARRRLLAVYRLLLEAADYDLADESEPKKCPARPGEVENAACADTQCTLLSYSNKL
jgi:hypothetical protein